MRILYICGDQGIPVFGRKGASTHIREMIAEFRRQGHEVALAVPDLSGDRRPEEDFPVCKLPAPKSKLLGSDGRYLLANFKAGGVLARFAADFRPEAIYERSALYFTAGEKLARRLALPRILEVNTLLAHELKNRLHYPGLAAKVEQGLVRRAPAIAAISITMKKRLVAIGCRADAVRPYGMAVDPRRFVPPADPAARRDELGWPSDAPVIGYVGSMNTYHRPDRFLALAEKVLEEGHSSARFLVVGGSESKVAAARERLSRWVGEQRVHFTGSVPQAEMTGWLCAMDMIVVPGAAPQSTPTKIFEAAALGRPMILPATEPIVELCGADSPLLFAPDDEAALEGLVRRFLAEPTFAQAPARRLRETVLAEHTWEHHARELAAWLETLHRAKA